MMADDRICLPSSVLRHRVTRQKGCAGGGVAARDQMTGIRVKNPVPADLRRFVKVGGSVSSDIISDP